MALLRRAAEALRSAIAIGLPILAFAAAPLSAQTATEYRVKAAFLFNFAKFVEWPASDSPVLTIGVLGSDPFGRALDEIVQDRTVQGRGLAVRRFHSLRELGACDILFVSPSESRKIAAVLERLAGQPVLTVGDSVQFARQGGVIGFFADNGKLRFAVNLDASGRAGLTLSSKMLNLARIVRDTTDTN